MNFDLQDGISVACAESCGRYRVSVDEYKRFRHEGFLVVRGLVPVADILELRSHTEELMQATSTSPLDGDGKQNLFMLHREFALYERFMLHPRVLDVLEALIGPDILALQTMLLLKPPGAVGQGWHQDSYFLPTHPDTLCGASIAIDDSDEENGALWFAARSCREPVYPPHGSEGFGTRELLDIREVSGVSNVNDDENDLTPVANEYRQVMVPAEAGDVVFFGGHVLHRSKRNESTHRFRRAFISHYCSARSFIQLGLDPFFPRESQMDIVVDPVTGGTSGSHILARGDSHLPFAKPRFGTPCAALLPAEDRLVNGGAMQVSMGERDSGTMTLSAAVPHVPRATADACGFEN